MGANARRGEISARLDGKDHTLCLTLGALAELETALGASDLVALGERFSTGRLSAKDMIAVIGAGLRGGGHALSDDEIGAMQADGGVAGFAQIAASLLLATFGGAEGGNPGNP